MTDTTVSLNRVGWRDRIDAVREKRMGSVVGGTISRWFTPAFVAREPAITEHFRDIIRGTSPEGFMGCCEAIVGYDVGARLKEIHVPTLVLVGAEDQATTPEMAKAIADTIPDACREVIASAAHRSNIEQPEAFNAALEQFLAR